jgi:hypothetical protein
MASPVKKQLAGLLAELSHSYCIIATYGPGPTAVPGLPLLK